MSTILIALAATIAITASYTSFYLLVLGKVQIEHRGRFAALPVRVIGAILAAWFFYLFVIFARIFFAQL